MDKIKSLLGIKKPRIKFYNSRMRAREACQGSYEDQDLVDVVAKKTFYYSQSILRNGVPNIDQGNAQILYPLAACLSETTVDEHPIRVLDFGGACGIHFLIAKAIFGNIFDWQVVETPTMVTAGRNTISGLQFFERVKDTFWHNCDRQMPHFVLSMGALPYTVAPRDALITLTQLKAPFLYVARMALADKEMYGVQWFRLSENGPGPMPDGFKDRDAYYPLTIMAKDEFEDIITSHGYKILCRFDQQGEFGKGVRQYGYLCEY